MPPPWRRIHGYGCAATLGNANDKMYVNGNQTASGQTASVWVGNGKIDVVLYKNWSEVGRYTVTVTP